MDHRALLLEIQMLTHHPLAALIEGIVKQARLARADQTGQFDGGIDITEGIMGGAVLDAIGDTEFLQAKTGATVLMARPLDPLGPQGIGHAHYIDQVPTRVTVTPLTLVGIVEVAIEGVAGHLIVKADAVIAQAAGTGSSQLFQNARHKLRLRHALLEGLLRGDAGHQAGLGLRQHIRGGTGKERQGFADEIQFQIGTHPGKLHRPVTLGIGAKGLVIVPIEGGGLSAHQDSDRVAGKGWLESLPCPSRHAETSI